MSDPASTDGGGTIEDDSLTGFLDWYRSVVVAKVAGLDRGEATRTSTPSGLTLLGIVKHLEWVEEGWFQEKLQGRAGHRRIDNPSSFTVAPDDTVDAAVTAYETECERSRQVVRDSPSLDVRAVQGHALFGHVTLRWILAHMIEETARHVGHMDVLRELTDGRVGD